MQIGIEQNDIFTEHGGIVYCSESHFMCEYANWHSAECISAEYRGTIKLLSCQNILLILSLEKDQVVSLTDTFKSSYFGLMLSMSIAATSDQFNKTFFGVINDPSGITSVKTKG
jgi:hypothetical protein